MMLRKGDMVRPVARRHHYRGGTLAIVTRAITFRCANGRPDDFGKTLQILWLNGGFRGRKTWDYLNMFEKVTE